MTPSSEAARERLAESRLELRRMFDNDEGASQVGNGEFPRSRTMRLLMEHPGLAVAAALVGGLLIARPGTAGRMLRALPLAAIGRMLLMRYLGHSLNERGAKH